MGRFFKYFLVVFTILFLQINIVSAASKCDYNEQVELNNAVANIKVSYEEAKGKIDPSEIITSVEGDYNATYFYFKVQIYNISENVYLKVTNDQNNDIKTFRYSDSESGVITFDWEDLENVTNLEIKVYSNEKTGCPNEEYRIIKLILPRYNKYSDSSKCTGNESFYLCQKYITEIEETDYESFSKKLTAFENNKIDEEGNKLESVNKTFKDNLVAFIKENRIVIGIISTVIVIGGVVTTVIVIKKRRSRLI